MYENYNFISENRKGEWVLVNRMEKAVKVKMHIPVGFLKMKQRGLVHLVFV